MLLTVLYVGVIEGYEVTFVVGSNMLPSIVVDCVVLGCSKMMNLDMLLAQEKWAFDIVGGGGGTAGGVGSSLCYWKTP